MKALTNVYVNIVGTGNNVLRDGTASCMGDTITNCKGTAVNGGPQYGEKYVLGSTQKIYYDVLCISEDGEPYKFKLKKNDAC